MLSRTLTAAAGLALVMIIVAVGLAIRNQDLRRELALRQQQINQGVMLSQMTTRLANTLGIIATRDNDAQLRNVLEQQGITPPAPGAQKGQASPNPKPEGDQK